MKKSVIFLLAALLLFITLPTATASAKSDGIFVYLVSGNEATITALNGQSEADLVIPESFENGKYTVTHIASQAFYAKDIIRTVKLPDTLLSIESKAFAECENLLTIIGGANLETVAPDAFDNTAYYKDRSNWENNILYLNNFILAVDPDIDGHVAIKEGTKYIPKSSFRTLSFLSSVTIPDSVTRIEEFAFSQCYLLERVSIGKNVTFVGQDAFPAIQEPYNLVDDCLTAVQANQTGEIIVPEGTRIIAEGAIEHQTEPISIKLPDSLEYINKYAFAACNLSEITIPEKVKLIDNYVFASCHNLKSVTVLGMDTVISKAAFFEAPSWGAKTCYPDILYCQKGSQAEAFATRHKIPFEYITVKEKTEPQTDGVVGQITTLITVILLGVLALVGGALLFVRKRKSR